MNVISVPPSRPLEPRKVGVLTKIIAACGGGLSQPMLVGAFARDVWFWHMHGIATERATEDVDISMAFLDWDGFHAFVRLLRDIGFDHLNSDHPEKLIDPETRQKLDLLPFGALSEDGRSIVWPTDQTPWGILGFAESFDAAFLLEVAPDKAIRIATLPSMVILKIVAFYERLEDRRRKDGSDIGFTLFHYLEVGNTLRLTEGDDADIMDGVGGDIERARAALLGRDIGRIAAPATRDHIVERLRNEIASRSNCPPRTRNPTKGFTGGIPEGTHPA